MSKTQWYAKSTYLLVALALVLSLWVVAVPLRGTVEAIATPTDYYVDAATGSNGNSGLDWANALKTITYAVETKATTAGDVIHVADGLYDPANGESFPIDFNTDDVSLIGAGGDTSIIDANNQEKNILNIWANGVSISWFELRNAKATFWRKTGNGIYMYDADNCNISNLKIYNLTEGASSDFETAGIFMDDSSGGNTFSSIEIYDISSCSVARGIWCYQCSGNQFSGINIHDVSVSNSCLSEFAVFGIHLSGSSGNTFDGITIDGITGGGEWAEGIQLSWSHNNTFGDLSISDVHGLAYVYGILLLDSSGNVFASSSEIWNIDAEFGCGIGIGLEKDTSGSNRNTFESFDIHDTCYGFYIDKSSDNLITKSNIHDNLEGLHICSGPNECERDALHCSNIYRNTDYGVYKENAPDVDATGNWWGHASGPSEEGPGTGDAVSTNVDYGSRLPDQFQYCEQCGGTRRPPPGVPTVNDWGIVAMVAIFGGLLVWRVRRRRMAS